MNTIETFIHEKKMTQTELAAKLGFAPSYVSMVINGDRPITDAFRWRWLEAFGPSALRILNGDDKHEPA